MTEPQQFDVVSDDHPVADLEPKALVEQVVQVIAQAAPEGWDDLHAVFSLAGGREIANAVAVVGDREPTQIPITSSVIELIRVHRRVTVGPQGPWLRLLFDCDKTGALQVSFDYGQEELPFDQLLPAEAYRRDIEEFPREVPLWLLAYMNNTGQQLRTAAQAVAEAVAVGGARVSDDEIPSLPTLWARIAVLAAVCRGSEAPINLRVDPAFQLYIGDNGGSTLCRLPGNRAVLSGGRKDSRLLSAAYGGVIGWPDLYRDAPSWLHNLYLDPRAERGLLSFCYWWDGEHWYRPELAGEDAWKPTDEIARGLPGVWTLESTASLVATVLKRIGVEPTDQNAYATADLVHAAEARIVTERVFGRLFVDGAPESFDMAEALAQLDAADLLLPTHPPIDRATATDRVVDFCRTHRVEYPLDRLVADRWDGGWQVFAPIAEGEIAIGRAVFLVADDGVVEQASTSAAPSQLAEVFARRFAQRIRKAR
ncbi:hypothetical protein [Mycobacteroides sp. LB1]|uniref:hypothetical protein n=1 Tax=Mycobacteroides sp. LB1 TaxID=2750814 RepID=UPI0015DDFBB9|nr:hypothetical protein [Mycobacteroides sp. LB1]